MAVKSEEQVEKAGLFTRAGAPVPLQGVEVSGELLGGHARVRVLQRYRNDEKKPVEAVYIFPLPSDGTLTAFSMTCDGRRVEGVIQERETAFKTYDDAITAGHGAALLDQERPNVFTAQVGNLLPGEETLVEVEFLQTLHAEEGCVRWMLPTLVAPRYIPGAPQGPRTSHGTAQPTNRVPDADRITPAVGDARYGLKVDLLVDLSREVVVESPSHKLKLTKVDGGAGQRVGLDAAHVVLDRDLVLTLRAQDTREPLTTLATHRRGTEAGTFALTVVPDLLELASIPKKQDVVFLVDVSGSMDGESLPQAKGALRLCLRHLREGDRFNIIAFDDSFRSCFNDAATFTQRTLEEADRWVAALQAGGGTELLAPMLAAVQGLPDGVVVLLTDGQVGNEDEILQAVLGARKTARVYSFGIGTNVSDALLKDMARQTDGAVEFIHPGERIDDKVVAQFSRALAPRVSDLEVTFEGVEGTELAPATLPPLVDGVPWTLFGRYTTPGHGKLVLRGRAGREPFALTVPVAFPDASERPMVEKLWAAERIRAWEGAALVGRRAEAMKDRIVQLALAHGIVTKYTSFVVVEKRAAERLATGQPETRVVPVHAPAGWAMFDTAKEEAEGSFGGAPAVPAGPPPPRRISQSMPAIQPMKKARSTGAFQAVPAPPPAPASMPAPSPARPAPAAAAPSKSGSILDRLLGVFGDSGAPPAPGAPPRMHSPASVAEAEESYADSFREARAEADYADDEAASYGFASPEPLEFESEAAPKQAEASGGPVALLGRQLANGLWAGVGSGPEPVRQARGTALALLELLHQGITSSHALHGAQVKKAVEALLTLAASLSNAPEVAELALGVAWLAASGPRTRGRITQAAQPHKGLSQHLGDEAGLLRHVDALASR
ncbi:VIT domain-containing protein [Myxococcaceae bacterium GXIMD 01537]